MIAREELSCLGVPREEPLGEDGLPFCVERHGEARLGVLRNWHAVLVQWRIDDGVAVQIDAEEELQGAEDGGRDAQLRGDRREESKRRPSVRKATSFALKGRLRRTTSGLSLTKFSLNVQPEELQGLAQVSAFADDERRERPRLTHQATMNMSSTPYCCIL